MLLNGKTTKSINAQKSKYVDFRVLTRCESNYNGNPFHTPTIYLP